MQTQVQTQARMLTGTAPSSSLVAWLSGRQSSVQHPLACSPGLASFQALSLRSCLPYPGKSGSVPGSSVMM